MTARKVVQREIIVQVSDGAGTPTWLGIAGVKSANLNPSENEETVDATEYASAGDYEGMVMQRGKSLKIEGFLVLDHITGVQDPGQARCETLAAAKGYASLGSVRFRYPTQSQWKVWTTGMFSNGEQGGGNNDLTTWSVTIVLSGASTTAAAP